MLNSYSDQQEQTQLLHPLLLQAEPVNTLNLPSLSNEGCSMPSVCEIPAALEGNGKRLAQSLAKLSDQSEKLASQTGWKLYLKQLTIHRKLLYLFLQIQVIQSWR
ncbi:hypothetical protein OS493_009117 [Desmophyllum pertusum]|uniref:Uncharacterized protein n=1 Tax=Desmophyllum pertusum TaxID=174260 RepID=A0A9W9Z2K8_9CNID|nr:hypothetical protein OS493_009117 [Desmophyllum pertusum]